MTDAPAFDEMLRQALGGLDNDDVRVFYAYFDELKRQVRGHLGSKARTMPGETAVAQSALLSLFCDLSLQRVPLSDVDEHGYPMLWPLLLEYIERHCDKWNKYYLAKKRRRMEVPLAAPRADAVGGTRPFDPPDYREPAESENDFVSACEALCTRLSDEERVVLEGRLKDETLAELATKIGRSESTVSNRLGHIRALLQEG